MRTNSIIRTEIKKNKSMMVLVVILGILSTVSGAALMYVSGFLISNREIIILDEPTSHLDIETEFEIKEKLLQLFEGRTVIIATHRLHWLNNMDYIVNLENGIIADFERIVDFKQSLRYVNLKNNLVGGGYDEK